MGNSHYIYSSIKPIPSSWFCKYSWQKNNILKETPDFLTGLLVVLVLLGGGRHLQPPPPRQHGHRGRQVHQQQQQHRHRRRRRSHARSLLRSLSRAVLTSLQDDCKSDLAGICFAPRRTNLSIGPVESRSMCALTGSRKRMAKSEEHLVKMFDPGNEPAFPR